MPLSFVIILIPSLLFCGADSVKRPDPRTKGRQLLDAAVEMLPAAVPEIQAETLGSIARMAAAKNPGASSLLIDRCMKVLEDVKAPANRFEAWDSLADAAHLTKDTQLVDRILDRAFTDAAELARIEERAPQLNAVLREFWPSTQAYRRTVMRATAIYGVDAEPVLAKIANQDINLLARIAMAETLLGSNSGRLRVYAPRQPRR